MISQIKDLAVYVSPNDEHHLTLETVAKFASKQQAHVTGIHVIAPIPTTIAGSGEIAAPQWILEQYTEASEKDSEQAQQAFESAMKAAGVTYQWISASGDPATVVTGYFRYADVGVVTQPKPRQLHDQRSIVNYILLNSGRPILVVPYIGSRQSIGRRVIAGWNGGVEATRALHDALPLLRNAEWVEVISIDKDIDVDELGSSVAVTEHLAHHGVSATATTYPKTKIDAGDVLINHASDRDADLIIAGAWGHTRAAEYVFGGTTRTLLEHMTVPVWMSH